MLLNIDVESIIKNLGINPLAIIAPELKPPLCYRGHIIDDFQWWMYSYIGKTLIPFCGKPITDNGVELASHDIGQLMRFNPGILEGIIIDTGIKHALAWDGKHCYDPRGRVFDINQFPPDFGLQIFWMLR